MTYTVRELAKISGVTERTIRWYDRIDLLKPAFHNSSGYRCYEQEQLLILQQILFYRELDFSLDEIKRVIKGSAFDKINALNSHKKALKKRLQRTEELIGTVNKTIKHLKGEIMIQDKDLYVGFKSWMKGKGEEACILVDTQDGMNKSERIVLENVIKQDTVNWSESKWEELENTYTGIYEKIATCLDEGQNPSSERMQKAVGDHYKLASKFYLCTKEVYIALAELYSEKKEFRKQLESFHPELPQFMADAMLIYAEKNL